MPKNIDSRSKPAIAYHWASRVMSLCIEMIVPCLVGYWVDGKLNCLPLFTLLGLAFGMFLGLKGLIQLARSQNESRGKESKKDLGGNGKR